REHARCDRVALGNSRVLNSKMLPPAVTVSLQSITARSSTSIRSGMSRHRCAFVKFDLRLTDPKAHTTRFDPSAVVQYPTKEARIVQQLLRTWQSLVPHLPHPGGNIDPSR